MARTSIWFSTAVLIWATTSVATMGQTPIVIGEPQATYPEPIDLDAWIEGQGSGGYYPENGCYPSGDCYPGGGCQLDGFFNNGCGGCFGFDSLLGGHYSGNSQANSTLHAPWSWQLLPRELIYRPQLASLHTARMAVSALNIRGFDPVGLPAGTHWYWDSTLGARIGIVRFGSPTGAYPQGFQFDVEGAIFPRQNSNGRMLIATDYRVGLPVSFGWRRYQTKFGFYHVSSHMGDEYILSTLQSLGQHVLTTCGIPSSGPIPTNGPKRSVPISTLPGPLTLTEEPSPGSFNSAPNTARSWRPVSVAHPLWRPMDIFFRHSIMEATLSSRPAGSGGAEIMGPCYDSVFNT